MWEHVGHRVVVSSFLNLRPQATWRREDLAPRSAWSWGFSGGHDMDFRRRRVSFSGGSPVGGVLGLEGVSHPPHTPRRVCWSVAVAGASGPCKQLSFAISRRTCDRHCDGAFGEQDLLVLGASNLGFGPDREAFLRRQSLQRWGGARSQGLGPGDPWWGVGYSLWS